MKNPSLCCGRRLLALASFFLALDVAERAAAALPAVDFNRMGQVGLAGNFAGLDLFDGSSSVEFDPTTSTILSRASDGSLTRLGSTNAGGKVAAGCALGESFYFAGSFSSVNGTAASNVAAYSPSNNTFSALGSGGPNGEVNAIFCDSTHSKVWVGGSFTSPGAAVAVWDLSSWSAPPFSGLSGAAAEVLSITTNSSASSLFFAGSFITSFGSNTTIVINSTNNPNVPFSSGATPFSSSLVPIPLQGAQINASPSSTDPNFSNINNTLCPAGADGPGETWLAQDGVVSHIEVQDFLQLNAVGIRLGNTFLSGHGTTAFSITGIPDNNKLTLTFIDPTTGQNQTCTDPCPLLTDSSVPYQDFLFPADTSLTGFQLTLEEFTGTGAGLHLMQLLSSGAFASAVSAGNGLSCFATNPSNITLVGAWVEKQVTTDIAGTVQEILTASVDVGTSSADGPSITWQPFVSASGNYNINMLIPGCTNFEDCALRTSVRVTIFPGGGLSPTLVEISQQNTEDSTQLLYSGPVFPTTADHVATVTMALGDDPLGTGQNGKYEIVADRIEFQLLSVNFTNGSSSSSSSTTNTTNAQQGFGFFEWPLSETSTVNAETSLPNTTETALDSVGFQLLSSIGGSSAATSTKDVIVAVAHHSSGAIFLGGNFSLASGSNIVAFKNGALVELASGGLNGPVTTLLLEGDTLYVGGGFTDTATPSTSGKASGIVSYDVNANSWSPLVAGVNGEVSSLNFADGQLEVTGNFTMIVAPASSSAGISTGGFAVWDANNSTWANNGGFLIGTMTFVGNSTSPSSGQQQSEILAGNVAASLQFGASGFVLLQNGASGSDGVPSVSTLSVQLEGSNGASTSSTKRRRSAASSALWLRGLEFWNLFTRASASPEPLPAAPPSPAPSVLDGTFWTNSSSSHQNVILVGNFSFVVGSSTSSGVAIYDLKTGTVNALAGNPIDGTVRAALVIGNTLYVGGEFTVSGSDVTGLAIYDLAKQQLDMSILQPLEGSSGADVVVRSLTASASKSNTIIVAGTFVSAGGAGCAGICELDTSSQEWSALGGGIVGEVTSVAYGGTNQDLLFASGSIALPDGTPANVAMFSFGNSSWTAVGSGSDLPGPVTAMTVDNGNASSVFAAGRSNDGSSSFLSFYNGSSWASLNSGFEGSTNISQLAFVPLQDTHSGNSIIEQDRMLLVSGSLISSSFGNASSVLFDGQTVFPYIVSSTASGDPGFVSTLFSSISNFSFSQRHVLAVGVVILISIAIAAGVVFLLVLLGILWTLFSRRDPGDKLDYIDDDDDSTHHRPSSLLETINAATRTTILGATSPFAAHKAKQEEAAGMGADPFVAHDGENYGRPETPSDGAGLAVGYDEPGRPARARYSFMGEGEGELPMAEGMDLEVLDDRDDNWWYARDVNSGREGVVPASYVF